VVKSVAEGGAMEKKNKSVQNIHHCMGFRRDLLLSLD
jgi:hypothetical protein